MQQPQGIIWDVEAVAVAFARGHPAEKLQSAGADLVVSSLEEVTVERVRRLLS